MFKLRTAVKSVLLALAISSIWAINCKAQESENPPPPPPPPPPPVVQPPPPPVAPPPPRAEAPPLQLPNITILNSVLPTDMTKMDRPGVPGDPEKARPLAPESYQFAMTSCQGMSDADNKYVVFPERGSLYKVVSPSKFALARGKMVVIADSEAVNILTAQARISVPQGSAAIVEASPQTGSTIFSLTGRRSLCVDFKDRSALDRNVELSAGQTVTIADKDLSAEELISVDGIERRAIEGGIRTVATTQIYSFSPQQLAGKNMLVACHDLQLYPSSKVARLVRGVEDRVQEEARSAGRNSLEVHSYNTVHPADANSAANYVLASSRTAAYALYRKPLSDESRFVVAAEKSVFHMSGSDTVNLELGTVLLRCKSPIRVEAGETEVRVSRNGVALVAFDGSALKVINLGDLKADSVVIARSHATLSVQTGREVILTAVPPALPHVFDLHQVGHRQVTARNLGNDGWVTTSEVDLRDVLLKHPLLFSVRQQAHSSDSERKLVAQVTKAAAIMTYMHANRQAFQRGVPADEEGGAAKVAGRCVSCQ